MDRFQGRARCPRCDWRGPRRVVVVENVIEEWETPEIARQENRDFARQERDGLLWADLLEHATDAHRLDVDPPSLYCTQCKQTVQLTKDGFLPVHDIDGKECANYGVQPRVRVMHGGSPGGGKRR